jgi:hypothetical protein
MYSLAHRWLWNCSKKKSEACCKIISNGLLKIQRNRYTSGFIRYPFSCNALKIVYGGRHKLLAEGDAGPGEGLHGILFPLSALGGRLELFSCCGAQQACALGRHMLKGGEYQYLQQWRLFPRPGTRRSALGHQELARSSTCQCRCFRPATY